MNSGNMRVGLTGARGVIGRTLQENFPQIAWHPFTGNVQNPEEITGWLQSPLDAIVHLAAVVSTKSVDAKPLEAFRTNVAGTCNLLEAVRQQSHKPWIFLASSSHVYGSSERPVTEDAPIAPRTLYGLTKVQAEQWALTYANSFGQPVCIGRIFSFSSPLQHESFFIPSIVARLRNAPAGASLEIPGLHGARDFMSARQVAEAIQFLLQRRATGVFNIGTGTGLRLLDVVTEIQRRLKREDVRIVAPETDRVSLVADVTKLERLGLRLASDIDALLDPILSADPGRRP